MRLVTDQALHREGERIEEMARELISRELRSERSERQGAGCEPEQPRNDGDVSEPYIIIVMGQL